MVSTTKLAGNEIVKNEFYFVGMSITAIPSIRLMIILKRHWSVAFTNNNYTVKMSQKLIRLKMQPNGSILLMH